MAIDWYTIGVWVGAFYTLGFFSLAYRVNPWLRFVESTWVGCVVACHCDRNTERIDPRYSPYSARTSVNRDTSSDSYCVRFTTIYAVLTTIQAL